MTPIEQVLELAIAKESEAERGFRALAQRAQREDLRELLEQLAAEEARHKASIERVREGDLTVFAGVTVRDEWLMAPPTGVAIEPDSDPAQALLSAMEDERQSRALYSGLAEQLSDPGLKTLLEALAAEELNHWRTLQRAYERIIAGGDL